MRALVVEALLPSYAGCVVKEIPTPEPGPGEVRIRHTAVALNFRDILVRRGQHVVKSFPSGLGTESAGVVEAVGEGVTDLAAGDFVATVCRPDCAYAEARIAPAARVVKLPAGIDDRDNTIDAQSRNCRLPRDFDEVAAERVRRELRLWITEG